ncbi:MAG: hypothetical protein OXI40_17940 [Chloroflexota bacterium]|nr:hypothetical protein [Chloroflexota bacterium]
MVVKEAKVPKWVSLWGMPEDVLGRIGEQIDYFQNATNRLGEQVRDIAQETIDLLLSSPIPNDIDEQKRDIVERYSAILVQFASTTADPHSTLNQMWTDMEQSVSFYLLDAGHNDDADPTEIRDLIDELTRQRNRIPVLTAKISNLAAAIKGSAGALPGLEVTITNSSDAFKRTESELNMGAGIMTRLIGMAEHQHKLLKAE